MPTVKVELDNLPKDAEVEIPGLGKFKNGSTTEVPQRRWNRYNLSRPESARIEGSSLEVSTAAAKEASAKQRELARALEAEVVVQQGGTPEDKPLSKRTKSELEDLARTMDLDPQGMSKDDLVALLSDDNSQEV